MNALTLNELYEEYTEARRTGLSYEQFAAFVLYYPALLVARTDGEIDEQEWLTLQGLANHLVHETLPQEADAEEQEDYRRLFFEEFRHLTNNMDRWDRKFMKSLKYVLAECPDAKQTVAATIYSLADASKGICEKERTMIEYLRGELGIRELGAGIRNDGISLLPEAKPPQPKFQAFLTTFWLGF